MEQVSEQIRMKRIMGSQKKDFLSKMYIAFKEASETEYWIKLFIKTNFSTEEQGNSILDECIELKRNLSSIIKTTKLDL